MCYQRGTRYDRSSNHARKYPVVSTYLCARLRIFTVMTILAKTSRQLANTLVLYRIGSPTSELRQFTISVILDIGTISPLGSPS